MSQTEYVLFSPIGSTDPIKYFRDGSMLHICRKFRPAHIYLYMTAEMLEHHRADDRYCYCIRKLYESLGLPVEIEVIERPEITDPYNYDIFYEEFRPLLMQIHSDHPDAQLLVNIASGTPPMKSELKTLAAVFPFRVISVQVVSPSKSQNKVFEDVDNYPVEDQWECDEDNDTEKYTDRCVFPKERNFNAIITTENICNQLQSYDYFAALSEARAFPELFGGEITDALTAAEERIRLIPQALKKHLPDEQQKWIARQFSSDISPLAEYVFWLDIKQKRGDLADFVRGLTPALYQLSYLYLQPILKENDIDLNRYLVCTRNHKYLTINLLDMDEDGRRIHQGLDNHFLHKNGRYYRDSDLSSEICIAVAETLTTPPDDTLNKLGIMRNFEETVRNSLAHEVTPISEDIIKKNTGINSAKAASLMRDIASSVLGLRKDDFQSYERLNDYITELLKSNVPGNSDE